MSIFVPMWLLVTVGVFVGIVILCAVLFFALIGLTLILETKNGYGHWK